MTGGARLRAIPCFACTLYNVQESIIQRKIADSK
jgi:hypothetical protein